MFRRSGVGAPTFTCGRGLLHYRREPADDGDDEGEEVFLPLAPERTRKKNKGMCPLDLSEPETSNLSLRFRPPQRSLVC